MKKSGDDMFEQFPKTRKPLPKEFADIYSAHYMSNRVGGTHAASLANRMEVWLHRQVAKDLVNLRDSSKTTLELGAGTLNQLQYEPDIGPYDIVEPFRELYKDSPLLSRIRNIYEDVAEVPASSRYDRITSIAAFEHVCNLPEVVARCGLLLAPNGVLRTAIPSEGTLLWTLGWKLTTGIEFKMRHGLDYGLMMRHEHVNTAREIEEVLEYFFEKVECNVFGLIKAMSFYQFYACSNPRSDRCRNYLGLN